MRLLIFSIGPIFRDVVHGGAQKVLLDVAEGLSVRGWHVDILSPPRDGVETPFQLKNGTTVYPIIPLRGSFPTPYGVSPFRIVSVQRILEEWLPRYDLFYIHDGSLLINAVKRIIPTVISLRDFCYQETLLGALNFEEDALIVNSVHTLGCLMDSFGQVNPAIAEKTHLIFNGYSPEAFSKQDNCQRAISFMGLDCTPGLKLIGFPHRPDMDKGFDVVLPVLRKLVNEDDSFRLLVPRYMDENVSDRARDTFSAFNLEIARLELQKHVIFHPWVPHDLMAEYYSLCSMVLCIGSFVESFSNVTVEALLCGTPVLATNRATYRTMPVKQFMTIAEYGNVDSLAEAAARIARGEMNCETMAAAYIAENLSTEKMLDGYQSVFEAAAGAKGQTVKRVTGEKRMRLTSWCSTSGGRIYDDYRQDALDTELEGRLFSEGRSFLREELRALGYSDDVVDDALRKGILIESEYNFEWKDYAE